MTSEIIHPMALAVAAFAATNADDLVILCVLFSRRELAPKQIVGGQLIGISALVLISLGMALLALKLPTQHLTLLGLIPICIGLKWMVSAGSSTSPESVAGLWTVVAIVMANGADNLGVYVPLFTILSGHDLAVVVVTFAVLTFGWCALARWAVNHRQWGKSIATTCNHVGPWVLIIIGLWILTGSLVPHCL